MNLSEMGVETPELIQLDQTETKKVRSFMDKLNDITVREDGTVTHNVFKKKDESGPREFKNMETFESWKRKHLRERREFLKNKLTPHQFYITQGVGTERPFTGEHWWTKDVGTYSCVCCSQRLFMYVINRAL